MMEQSLLATASGVEANDLLIFARVAELGGFSRAAERLGLPKSTVSRRIASLEASLGERLLLRTTRRQTLTEFGQQLLESARQVALEVDAVMALREHRQAAPSGRLRVSIPGDFAISLGNILVAFMAKYPLVALELDLSPRRVDLLDGSFDLAIRMGTLPDDAQLAARPLMVFSNGLYAAPAYLATRGEPSTPQELLQHDVVRQMGSDGEPEAWTLTQGEQRWQAVLPSRTTVNSPSMLLRLASAGAGIACVPDYLAASLVRRGELQRVLPGWRQPDHTVWAVFPGRKLMPAKTRVFINMLQASLSQCRTCTAQNCACHPAASGKGSTVAVTD